MDGGITSSIQGYGETTMSETRHFDAIMAGGGVMGCATAYYLMLQDPNLKVV
jgi:hypothetical protein